MSGSETVIELDDGWKTIQDMVDKLIDLIQDSSKSAKFSTGEYSSVYTLCYNMCTQRSPHNWSEALYARHGETIERYLQQHVIPALRGKSDEFLLQEAVKRWTHHTIMDKWMRKFFMYLDRYHVKHNSVPTLHEASLERFRSTVFEQVNDQFTAALLALINREREGEAVDHSLLKRCVAMYLAMTGTDQLYLDKLEKPLLEDSRRVYRGKASEWIAQDSLPVYLLKAEQALDTERERVDRYLEPQTRPKLERVLEDELLAAHETTLLDKEGSGLRQLLESDKKEDLARLFRLFKGVPRGLEPIAQMVKDHLTRAGEEVVRRREAALGGAAEKDLPPKERDAQDAALVQGLLELHDTASALVSAQFDAHPLFLKAQKEAFEVFVNHNAGKRSNAELLSGFCDRVLRAGGAKMSDSETESALERAVQLFSYLTDKDLFSEVYRNQLAKRLLAGRSASDDAERSLIAKLKLRCGAQFTSKMEGMVKDLLAGDDFKKAFKEMARAQPAKLQQRAAAGDSGSSAAAAQQHELFTVSARAPGDLVLVGDVEFGVETLTTGHWPTYKMVDMALPPALQHCLSAYEAFYADKTDHRKLKWVHTLGQASVRASLKRPYELQVTTLQACALLLFNDVPEGGWLPLSEVTRLLDVEEEVCKRIMHSLSCAKHRVLTKDPVSKGISHADKFKVNESFASQMRKIRLPMASLDESHNPKRVEEDRSIAIEAAIVRIMKARKRLTHAELVAETIQQLHFFRPNPRVVKQRIEHLIDREYLERDEEENNVYKYLA